MGNFAAPAQSHWESQSSHSQMMSASVKKGNEILYRALLRECNKLPTYNFREYFLKKHRDQRKELLADEVKLTNFLEQMRRMVLVQKTYTPRDMRFVIEKDQEKHDANDGSKQTWPNK